MSELWTMLAVRASEIMTVGEWYDREDMIVQLMPVVTPGPAIRRAERDRVNFHKRKIRKKTGKETGGGEPPPRIRPVSPEEVAAIGRRAIARDFLKAPCFEQQQVAIPGQRGGTKKTRTMVRLKYEPKRAVQQRHLERRRETKTHNPVEPLGAWQLHSPHQADAARLLLAAVNSLATLVDLPAIAARLGADEEDIRPLVRLVRRPLEDLALDLQTSVEIYVASTTR